MEGEHKIDQKYNQIIIDLIKHKLQPLRKNQKKPKLPDILKASKSNHHLKQAKFSTHSFIHAKVTPMHLDNPNNETALLEKVKQYLQSKRRESHAPQDKNYLEPYIQIFQGPFSNFSRAQRQSIEVNFFEVQHHHRRVGSDKTSLGFIEKQINLNQEESSILNAKIRRKLNHKKLVELHRRI